MEILALKLVLTPVLIGGAGLAGRRWGQGIGGWLVGLPFTAAPVAFFPALAALVERTGIAPAFAAAIAVSLALQGGTLWLVRRDARRALRLR